MQLACYHFYEERETVSRDGNKDSDEETGDADVPLLFIVIFDRVKLLIHSHFGK